METPLLASHPDNEDPSLLSFWPANDDDDGPSEFARLLEQRTPSLLHWRLTRPEIAVFDNASRMEEGEEEWIAGEWLLVGSGTASLLHLGFMWGAFVSPSWSATFLTIQTPFVTASVPLLTTRLANILTQFPTVVPLWISALVIPCLFMISAPSLILRDCHRPRNWNWKHNYGTSPRSIMECSIRWALFLFYFLAVLQLAVDSMHLHWTGTSITVHSQAQGGIVAFVAGVACALFALTCCRWPGKKRKIRQQQQPITDSAVGHEQHESVRHPIAEEAHTMMMVLEDTSTLEGPAVSFQPVFSPNDDDVERGNNDPLVHTNMPRYQKWLCQARLFRKSMFCKTVLVYQVGLFSLVLWLPAYTLPLLEWSSPHFSSHSQSLILWNLPKMLGQAGATAGTAYWIIALLGVVLMATVFVVPAMALLLSIAVWSSNFKQSRQCQSWLYALHPLMGQLVWCMALLFVTPALEPWSRQLLADNTNVCESISILVPSSDCFLLQADFQPGILLLVVQTISLELFVFLTLRWSV